MNNIRPKDSIPPQRFQWRALDGSPWRFGACFYSPSCEWWEIKTESGYAHFEEDPWESMGNLIGDATEFEWIDNDMEWSG